VLSSWSGALYNETNGLTRFLYRVAGFPLIGYPLLLCWQKGWLPTPRGELIVRLKGSRLMHCKLSGTTQRTMSLGLFEPAETRLIAMLLTPGDTFIDVGAHIGWFSTLAATCIGTAGRVIACEPYPANVSALRENLALNDARNVRVVEAAMGSRPGTICLAHAGDSGGVTALDWAHEGGVEVPMRTLDDVAQGTSAIRLLKVDVEGWEPHVLRGATKTLSRTSNVLIEINRPALKHAGSSAEEVLDLLRSAGFTSFSRVTQTGLRRLLRSDEVINVLVSR
jgi:FkbM family methyltransferase